MTDHRHDDLPADFERELLEYETQFKALVERLLQDHPLQGHPSSMTQQGSMPGTRDQIQLTAREVQLLPLLVAGYTNPQMGARLHLTRGAVRNYLGRLYRKLGVTRRTRAAIRVIELGLGDIGANVGAPDPAAMPRHQALGGVRARREAAVRALEQG